MQINIPNIIQAAGDARELIIDVKAIYKNLFGFTPYKIGELGSGVQFNDAVVTPFTKKTATKWGSNLYGLQDLIGREVFCPIVITCGGIDYNFPYACVGFRAPVIYKETPMVERGGSVNEEIALGALRITVKGFLIGAYGQFPDEEIDALATLRESTYPKYLKSPLTDRFLKKGDQVMMLDLIMPERQGVEGVKAFSFDLIEDSILDLTTIS